MKMKTDKLSALTYKEDGLYLIPEEKMPKMQKPKVLLNPNWNTSSTKDERTEVEKYYKALTQAIKEANIKVAEEDKFECMDVLADFAKNSQLEQISFEPKRYKLKQGEVYEVPLEFEVKVIDDESTIVNGPYGSVAMKSHQLAYIRREEIPTASQTKWEPKIVNEFLDASQFKGGDRINHYLVQALRQLDAKERIELAKALLSRSEQPEAKTEQESQKDIWFEFVKTCIQHSPFELDVENAKELYTITRNK